MKSSEKIAHGFLITGGDAAKMLDGVEKPLDEVAFAVEREVAVPIDLAVGFWWDHRLDGARCEAGDEAIAVVSLVGEEGIGLGLGSQGFGLRDVVNLAAGEAEYERISHGIDDGMDFRRETAARAPYGLVETPILRAPALC